MKSPSLFNDFLHIFEEKSVILQQIKSCDKLILFS